MNVGADIISPIFPARSIRICRGASRSARQYAFRRLSRPGTPEQKTTAHRLPVRSGFSFVQLLILVALPLDALQELPAQTLARGDLPHAEQTLRVALNGLPALVRGEGEIIVTKVP